MTAESRGYLDTDLAAAEALAVDALAFLAATPEELGRFLALTGLGPSNLRRAAADPAFLGGVLDHLMANEELLVAYAAQRGRKPAEVAAAARRLREGPAERPRRDKRG